MQSLYELQRYLIETLDHDIYIKEVRPLLEKVSKEHFDALEKQLERVKKIIFNHDKYIK